MMATQAERLEQRIRRLTDILEIRALQSRYVHWLALNRVDKILDCFAQRTAGVSVEAGDSGVLEGLDGIRRHFGGAERRGEGGTLYEFHAENFVIEVSSDGVHATAICFSPGITAVGSESLQAWSYGKYDNDYVKEEGRWKILHLRWRTSFQTPFEVGWTHQQSISSMRTPPLYPPAAEITWHLPYSPYGVNYLVPEPREPGRRQRILGS